ncbi:MAG: PCRF domain-containing protein, partial [Bacteroidales bacterium]|nr:PCRF domain-containing protein [Bacteroidales bacterium]
MDRKKIEVEEEDEKTHDPEFWNNPKEAEKFLKELKSKKYWVDSHAKIITEYEDLIVLVEFAEMEEATEEEVIAQQKTVIDLIEDLEFLNMLSGEEDKLGAVLKIQPGAGGTESQDWAQMLTRMYIRWGERNNIKIKELDYQEGEVAGIK